MSRTGTAIARATGVRLSLRGHRRGARPSRRRLLAATGFLAALTLAVTLGSPVSPARAVDYPSWQDLQNAKSNASAAQAKVAEIQSLIANLQVQVAETQAAAEARGVELQTAQEKFDEATRRATDLQTQADAGKATADAATKQAGQLASQLYRTGGTDLSVNLFLDGRESGQGADELLSKLGSMSKLVERSTDIYENAQAARNTAQSLGDQAKIAQAERETLRIAAEAALAAAQAAAEAAASALAESEAQSIVLDEQLKFMQDTLATTAAGYEAGVAERKRIADEQARLAAAANHGSAGAGLDGGSISSQGWAVPATGRITDGYGPRAVVCGGGSCSKGFHSGTDIGTGCGRSIYAAHDGVVSYAGRYGTYGNFILIDHGNGIQTGYAHIRDGGIFVGVGQGVGAGQNIASSGTTGASTGCHLHFEVRQGGNTINAQPFMADRGAPLG
ncbi:peptidoglycan DD-metalloendopeptidase family protein [Glaciibacter sp. 2TAF33]|uniref:peptidoglycan DD-metalloendopeptidase family protein n=1 Tax=Glaciibacter sp. 2TAF33 TaxID=3233015 RepID=UPI003F932DC9